MSRTAFIHGRRRRGRRYRHRRNPSAPRDTTEAEINKLTEKCHKNYPPVKVGLSILSFGAHGVTRNKRRNDCLAAAKGGKGDPRAKTGTGNKPVLMSKPYKLWAVKDPWLERPTDVTGNVLNAIGLKTGGDTLRSMANGRRPKNKEHLRELEREATIIGGLMTLQALGEEPWASINLEDIQPLKLRTGGEYNHKNPLLLRLVVLGAKQEGKVAPTSIKEAAEFMRQRLIDSDAGGPAWYGRAMHLTLAGSGATDKRSKVEGAISSGTGLAAKGLYAAAAATGPTIIGPIVIGAVGGIMDGISLGMGVLAGRSKIESARAIGESQGFAQKFEQALDKRAVRQQKKLLDMQIKVAEAQQALEEEAARVQAEKIVKVITATVWVGVLGGTAFLGYVAVRAIKRRRAA
jgi:hypothetical protein